MEYQAHEITPELAAQMAAKAEAFGLVATESPSVQPLEIEQGDVVEYVQDEEALAE